jgi:hypothetical protein
MTVHLPIAAAAPETAQARFRRLRRDTNRALLTWIRERPDPRDVADEVAASVNTLQQLGELARADLI